MNIADINTSVLRDLHTASIIAGAIALGGVPAVLAGLIAVERFAAIAPPRPKSRPPVTVLRPLCGAEPMLEAALASICTQSYPSVQIVLGVQDPQDPAVRVVERVRRRFPAADITLVVDPTEHGANRKIGNLLNMMPFARHDLLVFCDSDLHVAPDYLDGIAAALEVPGTGLVTTVCAGLPAVRGLAAQLGATAISHYFVPGALLARLLGRQDCLGTTMALTRQTLQAVGGLAALRDNLADDNVLGQLVRRLDLSVALSRTVPLTAVPEKSVRALWQHELRWARTIRALEPLLFSLSVVQYPLFWAAACLLLSPCRASGGLFVLTLALRGWTAYRIDRALQPGRPAPVALLMLLPMRDILSVLQIAASFLGSKVVWRGRVLSADGGRIERKAGGFAPSTPIGVGGPQTP